jgi:hypothetical protein
LFLWLWHAIVLPDFPRILCKHLLLVIRRARKI